MKRKCSGFLSLLLAACMAVSGFTSALAAAGTPSSAGLTEESAAFEDSVSPEDSLADADLEIRGNLQTPSDSLPPEKAPEPMAESPQGGTAYGEVLYTIDGTGDELTLTIQAGSGGVIPDCNYKAGENQKLPPWSGKRTQIKKLVIGPGITAIGKQNFDGMENLAEVRFEGENPIESVGDGAFKGCSALTSIEFPATTDLTIGKNAFNGASSLATVNFGNLEGTLTIENANAFGGCTGLSIIYLPASCSIPEGTFSDCKNLSEIYFHGDADAWENVKGGFGTLNENVTVKVWNGADDYEDLPQSGGESGEVLGSGTFKEKVKWSVTQSDSGYTLTINPAVEGTEAEIPDTAKLKNDSNKAPWYDYRDRITDVVIDADITAIGTQNFLNFTALKNVTFEEGSKLVSTGNGPFYNCLSLEEIEFPDSFTTFGKNVFNMDEGNLDVEVGPEVSKSGVLSKVSLPKGMKEIGEGLFKGCTGPIDVYFRGTEEDWKALKGQNVTGLEQLTAENVNLYLMVGDGFSDTPYKDDGSGTAGNKTSGTANGKNGGTFSWEITTKGDEVTLTLDSADDNLVDLPDATVAKNKNFPVWYDYQEQVTHLFIGSGIKSIGQQNFYGMSALKTVEFEKGSQLELVYAGAFRNCISLTEITFPDTLRGIWGNQFTADESLTKVDLGNYSGEFSIGNLAFKQCSNLDTIYLPNDPGPIQHNAFNSCYNLRNIYYRGTLSEWMELMKKRELTDDASNPTFGNKEDFGSHDNVDLDLLASPDVNLYTLLENGKFSDEPVQAGVTDISAAGDGSVKAYMDYTGSSVVLTIYGEGEISDKQSGAEALWSDTKNSAKPVSAVVLFNNVKQIPANAFSDVSGISKILYFGSESEWKSLAAGSGAGNEDFFNKPHECKIEGDLGTGVSYKMTYNDDLYYTLTFNGSGPVPDFESRMQPWYRAKNFISELDVKDGVTALGDYSIADFTRLTQVELPGSVTRVGVYTFRSNTALKMIIFNEGFLSIGRAAFSSCAALTDIYLPVSFQAVDLKAFEYCASLKTVHYAGTADQWKDVIVDNDRNWNQRFLEATKVFGEALAGGFTDAGANLDAAEYMYQKGLMDAQSAENGIFGADLPLTADEAVNILYKIAGSDDRFEDYKEWASFSEIFKGAYGSSMTFRGLAELLYRTALYNGRAEEGITDFISWAVEQGLMDQGVSPDKEVTRGEAAAVFMKYLESDDNLSVADRGTRITQTLRNVLANGNPDGKMYIVAPNLHLDNKGNKVGDCTFIIFPNGQTMLVDAGYTDFSEMIVKFLSDVGVTKLDYMVASHAHYDHIGGMPAVCDYIFDKEGGEITNFWYPESYAESNLNIDVLPKLREHNTNIEPKNLSDVDFTKDLTAEKLFGEIEKTKVTVGEGGKKVTIEIFGPDSSHIKEVNGGKGTVNDESVNNTSMGMKFTFGESVYITAGDWYMSMEKALCDRLEEFGRLGFLKATVAKVNHHGADQSSGSQWVNAVSPQIAITETDGSIGGGVKERYESVGADCFVPNPNIDGTIMVVLDNNDTAKVITQFDGTLRKSDSDVDLPPYEKPEPDWSDDDDSSWDDGETGASSGGDWVVQPDGGWKLRKPDGSYAKNSWEFVNGKWYYFQGNERMAEGWQLLNGVWYHLAKGSGAMDTGWYLSDTDGKWYYLDPASGAMRVGWVFLKGTWYHLALGNGAMDTGWYLYDKDGKWYYLDPVSGAMRTGWIQLGDTWYCLAQPDGAMYCDEVTPDGYRVNGKGEWK